MPTQRLIAIDPGKNGGIAYTTEFGDVAVEKMPATPRDIWLRFCRFYDEGFRALLENTRAYVPGTSGATAAKLARHCGHLDICLTGNNIPVEEVAPRTWQTAVCGKLPKEQRDKKNAIKARMQALYPHISVTLWNADALGIYTYGLNLYR